MTAQSRISGAHVRSLEELELSSWVSDIPWKEPVSGPQGLTIILLR